MRLITILIIVFLPLFITFLYADDVDEIIENVQDAYEDMDYLSAVFKQVNTFKLTNSVSEITGKIYVAGGEKYRFESDEQTIATDGKTIWAFNRRTNQLLIDHAEKNASALLPRDLLFKYPQKYYATLLREDKFAGKPVFVIKMDPKEDVHGYIKSMKLWIDKNEWHILKIETSDMNDNTTIFEITEMDTKSKLSGHLFSIEPAENVEVVDRR